MATDILNEPEDLTILNVRSVPRPLRQRFASWCSARGLYMSGAVRTIIKEIVEPGSTLVDETILAKMKEDREDPD